MVDRPEGGSRARQNAETVIEKATAALKKELNDPQRIGKFVANLRGSPEDTRVCPARIACVRRGRHAATDRDAADETDPSQRALILNYSALVLRFGPAAPRGDRYG